jgi:CBS domain containing-hemolysin-like protein
MSILLTRACNGVLGHDHAAFFRRSELAVLMDVHLEASKENEDPLTEGETKIIKGCLKMREKTIGDVMTTLDNVYMLPFPTRLNDDQMSEVRLTSLPTACMHAFNFKVL